MSRFLSQLATRTAEGGTPGLIRTADTRFRKPVLYPLSYRGNNISFSLSLPDPDFQYFSLSRASLRSISVGYFSDRLQYDKARHRMVSLEVVPQLTPPNLVVISCQEVFGVFEG